MSLIQMKKFNCLGKVCINCVATESMY